MKPAPFDYVRPTSLAEACALLAGDEEARVISVVSPAGLERYYEALAELPPGPKDISVMQKIMAGFGIELRLPAESH